MLRLFVADNQKKWDAYLPALSYACNRGVHKSLRTTPFELVLARPPTAIGAETLSNVPVIGPGWSKATFFRRLRESISDETKRLEKAQRRYKREFDKSVDAVNRELKTGHEAFHYIRKTPAETTLLGRRRNKLDWKTVGPYTVLANDGATIVLDVNGVPERINSDRIRPSPLRDDVLPSAKSAGRAVETSLPETSSDDGVGIEESVPETDAASDAAESPFSNVGFPTQTPSDTPGTGEIRPTKPISSDTPDADATAPGEIYVIEKLLRRGRDKDGKVWAFVKWYGYPASQGTWEPEDSLPPLIVARLARSKSGKSETLSERNISFTLSTTPYSTIVELFWLYSGHEKKPGKRLLTILRRQGDKSFSKYRFAAYRTWHSEMRYRMNVGVQSHCCGAFLRGGNFPSSAIRKILS